MEIHHIEIIRQARIATLGVTQNVRQIWIVLHGYGYLATYFIRKFEPINNGETLIVAPEGLHRFYRDGLSGRVGASWMTKEDRLTDIADNNRYLNSVWNNYREQFPEAEIGVIGFSQGAATAVRWFCQAQELPTQLIVWAGSFPEDLNWFEDVPKLNQRPLLFVLGTNDPFFDEEKIEQQTSSLRAKGLQFDIVRFDGGHDIDPQTLVALIKDA